MFLLQLQLYVLTIICVTLRRIQKPFRRKSTVFVHALCSDCSERAIHWSIVLARIDLVSLYFRLLWYHSILRGSIDQKHAKTNEIWRQNSKIHSAFACSRWLPWFPDFSRPYGACVMHGSGETYVRPQSFSSESAVKYLHVGRRKIQISPPLGEQDRSNALPQGQQRQSNPHPMPCLSPRRHGIDKCILPAVEMSRRNSSIGVSPSVFSLIGTICPTNVVLFKETICSKNLVKITPQDCKIKVHFRLTWVALNYPVYSRTLPPPFSDFFWEDGAAVP